MQSHREPHRVLERSLSVEGGDPSPLERIAVALEGLRTECRRIADSVEVCPLAPRVQVAELEEHDSLTGKVRLAAEERPRSPYLGAGEAAEYLGITVSSLYGVVERGHVVPLRGPRRSYRFTESMLDEYLKRQK